MTAAFINGVNLGFAIGAGILGAAAGLALVAIPFMLCWYGLEKLGTKLGLL